MSKLLASTKQHRDSIVTDGVDVIWSAVSIHMALSHTLTTYMYMYMIYVHVHVYDIRTGTPPLNPVSAPGDVTGGRTTDLGKDITTRCE